MLRSPLHYIFYHDYEYIMVDVVDNSLIVRLMIDKKNVIIDII